MNSTTVNGTETNETVLAALNILASLSLLAYTEVPSLAFDSTWITEPPTYRTLGADVNERFFVVGLPKICERQFVSSEPTFSKNGHDFFRISSSPTIFLEVRYSRDGQTISSFRFEDGSGQPDASELFGGWQRADKRLSSEQCMTELAVCKQGMIDDPLRMPFGTRPFTPEAWHDNRHHNKTELLFHLTHDYRILGLDFTAIKATLGEPDYKPLKPAETGTPFQHVDCYVLSYGCEGVTSVFEIGYKDNIAVAFRINKSPNSWQ